MKESKDATAAVTLPTKKAVRELPYVFNPEEHDQNAVTLAETCREIHNLEEEKKEIGRDYTSRINRLKAKVTLFSDRVNDGRELRNVEVEITFNEPNAGQKTVRRLDNGETLEVSAMDPNECQMELDLQNSKAEASDLLPGQAVAAEPELWTGDADQANKAFGDNFGVDWSYTNEEAKTIRVGERTIAVGEPLYEPLPEWSNEEKVGEALAEGETREGTEIPEENIEHVDALAEGIKLEGNEISGGEENNVGSGEVVKAETYTGPDNSGGTKKTKAALDKEAPE